MINLSQTASNEKSLFLTPNMSYVNVVAMDQCSVPFPKLGKYTIHNVISELTGSGSAIYLAQGPDGQLYSLKKYPTNNPSVQREADTLKILTFPPTPYIQDYKEFVADEDAVYLVSSLGTQGNLVQKVQLYGYDGLPAELLKRYCYDIISSVLYCHERGFCHLDLKPDNFLVSGGGVALIDFGLAQPLSVDIRTVTTGNVLFIPPELWSTTDNKASDRCRGDLCDSWAVGLIIHFCASGRLPIQTFSSTVYEALASSDYIEISKSIPSDLRSLISKLLKTDPSHRWTLKQAIEHKYFKNLF